MSLRPLMVIALMIAASPAAADDGAIRLFAPVPSGSSPTAQAPARQTSSQQAGAIRLFSPVSSSPKPEQPLPMAAPAIRGAVHEKIAAQAPPVDRSWTVALP